MLASKKARESVHNEAGFAYKLLQEQALPGAVKSNPRSDPNYCPYPTLPPGEKV